MFKNYDYNGSIKSIVKDKKDRKAVHEQNEFDDLLQNQANALKDDPDARYNAGMALGDPESADIRIVALGHSGSGNSSLMLRMIYNEWDDGDIEDNQLLQWDQHQTEQIWDGETLRISYFDLKGFDDVLSRKEMEQRIGDSINHSFNVILLYYAVDDRVSFEDDDGFSVQDIKQMVDCYLRLIDADKFIVVLAALKADVDDRTVTTSEGAKLAAKWGGIPFVELSAKTGEGVQAMTDILCSLYLEGAHLIDGDLIEAAEFDEDQSSLKLSSFKDRDSGLNVFGQSAPSKKWPSTDIDDDWKTPTESRVNYSVSVGSDIDGAATILEPLEEHSQFMDDDTEPTLADSEQIPQGHPRDEVQLGTIGVGGPGQGRQDESDYETVGGGNGVNGVNGGNGHNVDDEEDDGKTESAQSEEAKTEDIAKEEAAGHGIGGVDGRSRSSGIDCGVMAKPSEVHRTRPRNNGFSKKTMSVKEFKAVPLRDLVEGDESLRDNFDIARKIGLFFDGQFGDTDTVCMVSESGKMPAISYWVKGDYVRRDDDVAGKEVMVYRACRHREAKQPKVTAAEFEKFVKKISVQYQHCSVDKICDLMDERFGSGCHYARSTAKKPRFDIFSRFSDKYDAGFKMPSGAYVIAWRR